MAATDASLFDVYFANSLNIFPVQADDDDGSSGVVELRGWLAKTGHGRGWYCSRAGVVSGQQRCADHKILIHIIPLSLTEDPRPQFLSLQLVRIW